MMGYYVFTLAIHVCPHFVLLDNLSIYEWISFKFYICIFIKNVVRSLLMGKVNPIALRMAKTLWSFGHSECNRVKELQTE